MGEGKKNLSLKSGGVRGKKKPRTLSWGWVGFHPIEKKKPQNRIFWMVQWWVLGRSSPP